MISLSNIAKALKIIHREFPQAFINKDWTFISLCIARKGFLEKVLDRKLEMALICSIDEACKN